jgi:hypothetical protein
MEWKRRGEVEDGREQGDEESWGTYFVNLGDELEQGIVGEVLEGELALACVARVSLAEHGVPESGNDATCVESFPDDFGQTLVAYFLVSQLMFEFSNPCEHFLVGESVEGSGETVETSREGDVGVGESAADEVSGVCGDVSSLVVTVDHEVEAHEVVKFGTVEAELAGEVGRQVKAGVERDEFAILVCVLVDHGGNGGQLGCTKSK